MMLRNRLCWRDDRASLFRAGRPNLAVQVEVRLEAENAALRHQLVQLVIARAIYCIG
jgi:hypothetical protein